MKNPFYRKPDFYVGGKTNPYMLRWWVIPRNKWFNIYLHKFLRDDEDRAAHNHPWVSWSFILKGSYTEYRPIKFLNSFSGKVEIIGYETEVFKRFSFIRRKADYYHRIELFKDKQYIPREDGLGIQRREEDSMPLKFYAPRSVWTLFITGPKIQDWGFLCPHGFRRWQDFVHPDDKGAVGPGCE